MSNKPRLKKENLNESTNNKKIVFSFELLKDKKFGIEGLDLTRAKAFIERLDILSNLTWDQILKSNRHNLGTEIIPISQLNITIPYALKSKNILIFRYYENLGFAGYRDGQVFYILCFDNKYKLYKHS